MHRNKPLLYCETVGWLHVDYRRCLSCGSLRSHDLSTMDLIRHDNTNIKHSVAAKPHVLNAGLGLRTCALLKYLSTAYPIKDTRWWLILFIPHAPVPSIYVLRYLKS